MRTKKKHPPNAKRPEWLDEYSRLKEEGLSNSRIAKLLARKGFLSLKNRRIDTSSMRSAVIRWHKYGECGPFKPDRPGRHFLGRHPNPNTPRVEE